MRMLARSENPLTSYIVLVSFIYLFLFLLIYGAGKFLGLNWRVKDWQVVESSVRVDVVGMPKWTQRELLQIQNNQGESTRAAVEEKLNPSPEGSFLEKIKKFAQRKIERRKSGSAPRKRSKSKGSNGELKKLIMAGNKLSAGTALTGKVNSEQLTELRRYMESLPFFIKPHWILPSYLKERELRCRIRVFIGSGGKLLKSEVVESSGDALYDSYALKALSQAELPAPDPSLAKQLVSGVVILGFPL